MLTSKNRERRSDQKWKEFTTRYPQIMDAINQFLCKRFTGIENMISDNVMRG